MPWLNKHIRIQKTNVFYQTTGKGMPVVLLHGFLEDHSIWDAYLSLCNTLAVQLIRIDLPGHGRSEVLAPVQNMAMMAEIVKAVMNDLNVYTAAFIGHSMGGYVGLAFAERYPERVVGLCLFHSHAHADTPQKKKDRERAIKVFRYNPKVFVSEAIPNLFAPENAALYPDAVARIRAVAVQTSPESIEACLLGMRNRPDLLHFFHHLPVPKLVLAGDLDPVMPLEKLKDHTVPNSKWSPVLTVLQNTGHMGFVESERMSVLVLKKWCLKLLAYAGNAGHHFS